MFPISVLPSPLHAKYHTEAGDSNACGGRSSSARRLPTPGWMTEASDANRTRVWQRERRAAQEREEEEQNGMDG